MLLQTATEEIGHVEMLATAVALNLEGASIKMQEEAAKDGAVNAVLVGMNPRHFLSAGLAALPVNANGIQFDSFNIYASGSITGDMLSNGAGENRLKLRLSHFKCGR